MEALINKFVLALSIGLQLAILFLIARGRLWRRFLWFSIYTGYVLIEAVARLAVAGNRALYFNVYWLTAIGSVILSVMALRESFLNVFWMYTRFRLLTRIIWSCVGLALLYAGFYAWAFPPTHASRLGAVIVGLESAVNYSFTAVGVLYFLLVRFEKIKEHQWESGVIAGFAMIGALSALAVLTRSVFGPQPFNRWIEPVAYILAQIEWAFALSRTEMEIPKWVRDRKLTIDDLTRLDQYSTFFARIFRRK